MARETILLPVSLAIGLAVTLATAAAVATRDDGSMEGLAEIDATAMPEVWRQYAGPGWPDAPHFAGSARRAALSWRAAVHHRPGGDLYAVREITAGWPLGCLRGAALVTEPPLVRRGVGGWIRADGRVVPRQPVGAGLAVNTVFFGAAVYLLVRVITVLAQRSRRVDRPRVQPIAGS